jgi:putative transposase
VSYNRCVSIYIHKSHNVTTLVYHLVFPVKYRKSIIDTQIDNLIRTICLEIQNRYEIQFLEIGTDTNHVHFLIQSVPSLSVTKLVTIIKSITARELLKAIPNLKEILWGAHIWTSGYFATTISKHGSEKVISRYVKEQGLSYHQLHKDQLQLFV